MVRDKRPHMMCLKELQKYSTRGWVYREDEGWIFAELTPDERAEFKSYQAGIAIPRMKVRIPHGEVSYFLYENTRTHANWFAYCIMPQVHPLMFTRFQIYHVIDEKPLHGLLYRTRYPVVTGSYEAWLWADEVKSSRELGCEITLLGGWGWHEWGVPTEWGVPVTKPLRVRYKERASIYALVDALTQEVGYVGQANNPKQRYTQHMRDASNRERLAWIQSLQAQGRNPELIILEEGVIGKKEIYERERYWVSYYWKQGYNLTNRTCRYWKKPKKKMKK